jgi:hypothetical protein
MSAAPVPPDGDGREGKERERYLRPVERDDQAAATEPRVDPGTSRRDQPLLAALILIGLGLFFLIANFVPISGGWLLFALGIIFLVARVVTGRYGFAVPAGVLLGIGTFVALAEAGVLLNGGGWFFILLGLGFLAVYAIGAIWSQVWPLYPAAALAAFGVLLLGVIDVRPLARLAWLWTSWGPIVLIAIGLWILLSGRVPAAYRRPLAAGGIIALVLYGIVAVAAAFATAETGATSIWLPGMRAPYTETETLTAPLGPAGILRTENNAGQTVIRPGTGGAMRIVATKYYWTRGQAPDVRLTNANGITLLQTSPGNEGVVGRSPRVDLEIEVPLRTPLEVISSSGNVRIDPLESPVQVRTSSGDVSVNGAATASIQTSSGDVALTGVPGPVTVLTSSGDMKLSRVSGELRLNASSGRIEATDVTNLRSATTSSGNIVLSGLLLNSGDAAIQSNSGDVTIRFLPASDLRVNAITESGAIRVQDQILPNVVQDRRNLSGTLGRGRAALQIRTSSGDVVLGMAPSP